MLEAEAEEESSQAENATVRLSMGRSVEGTGHIVAFPDLVHLLALLILGPL